MSVRDGRRAPFCWLSIGALELIASRVPEGTVAGIRNTYLALAEVASAARDGHHEGFEATLAQIAAAAHVDRATVKRHLPTLAELGLLEVERRTAHNGATLPSVYVLLEPGQSETGPSEPPRAHETPRVHHAPPVHESTPHAPPTRAHRTPAKKEESLLQPPTPRAPLAGQLLEDQEGEAEVAITYRDQAMRHDCSKCGAASGEPCIGRRGPRESAHAERHATAIAAGAPVLTADRQGAPPTRKPRSGPRENGTNPTALGTNPRALGTNPRAVAARGPEPDPPTAELTAGWHAIRSELEAAVGDAPWNLYLQPLELAGHRGTELVLTAPGPRAAWITERFGRLLAAAVRTHLGPDTTVTVQPARAAAAA